MKPIHFVLLLFFEPFILVNAQDKKDTLSFFEHISKGSISGYSRTFFMATQNEGTLKDWSSLATGGLLKYKTNPFHSFSATVGYYQSNNLMINDGMTEVDTSTGKLSRYETGLYDLEDLNKKQISLLGELSLDYEKNGFKATFGRFKLVSPFINPEHGRMIPTLVQGGWLKYQPDKTMLFQGGFISHIAVRGTSKFNTVANSIGIFPVGKAASGKNSDYKGNLTSKGIGVLNVTIDKKKWGINAWDYYVDNIFNTSIIEPFVKFGNKKLKHKISAQHVYQIQLNDGGNADVNKTYFADKSAQIYGAQYKLSINKKWNFSASWNYITAQGQFLFPREWGREFLFVFQKRERLEGDANTQAWVVDAKRNFILKDKHLLNVSLGYGQYYRPDVKDFANNKYAFPANDQLNVDLFFFARKDKKGFGIEWLTVFKRALGETYDNPNFILNKVNMINHNVIVHYRF